LPPDSSDRILIHPIPVTKFGKTIQQGDRDRTLRKPQHEYTKKLIATVPVPDPKEQRQRREARRG